MRLYALKQRCSWLFQGLSQQEIAEQVGLSQPAVSRAIARALKQHRDEGVDMLRAVDGLRLEELFRVAFDQAKEGDMQAANVVVRTLERRAKLRMVWTRTERRGTGLLLPKSSSFMITTHGLTPGALRQRNWRLYPRRTVHRGMTTTWPHRAAGKKAPNHEDCRPTEQQESR